MLLVIIRGGGDLASGIAIRLHRAGIKVVITELQQPLAVRRLVSFCEAVYSNSIMIEEIKGVLFTKTDGISKTVLDQCIPVLIDSDLSRVLQLNPQIIIDARMRKIESESKLLVKQMQIGIGPGFMAGINCDCVIETKRGPYLGRVYWEGAAEQDSGLPDRVGVFEKERVLRAPAQGEVKAFATIGDLLEAGDLIAEIGGKQINAPFNGVLRGMIHEGVLVTKGMKIGDLDPRGDPLLCGLVSDKALSIGGAALEAILSKENLRKQLND
ncbi:MAG: selenium-dependent molybdenum cofactor biosynthesis protein YqeB [Leptolinea sp.]